MKRVDRLEQIEINGYKSIEKLDLKLNSLNVIIGANGAGKSNFISIFKFLNQLLLKNLGFYVSQQSGTEKFLYFGSKRTPKLQISLQFSAETYFCELVPDITGKRFVFAAERSGPKLPTEPGCHRLPPFDLIKKGDYESGLSDVHSAKRSQVASYLNDLKAYHFHDTSASALVKKLHKISDNHTLASDASNLAAFLYSIRTTPAYQEIKSTIQRVAPFFLDFFLKPEENPESIQLRWRHRGSESIFDASDLSDGTLRFICLTTLLLQPNLPNIILLDEPELGLHPFALALLAGMMHSVSGQTQIICSTQSVTFANQFGWEDLIITDRVNEASIFRRMTEEEIKPWLEDFEYGVGDLWEKNIIGGNPL